MTLTESADTYLKKTQALAENQTSHKLAGLLIQHYRQKLGLRASKLADQLNISPSVISKIEGGMQRVGSRAGALQLETLWDVLKIDDHIDRAKLMILYGTKNNVEATSWNEHNVTAIDIVNSLMKDIERRELRYSEAEEFCELLAPVFAKGEFLFRRAKLAMMYKKYKEAMFLYQDAFASQDSAWEPTEENHANYSAVLYHAGSELLNSANAKAVKNYLDVDAIAKEEVERDYKVIIDHYLEPALTQAKKALNLNPLYSDAILQLAFVHYALSFADSEHKLYHASQATTYFTMLRKSYENPHLKVFDTTGYHENAFNLIPLFRARMYALQGEEYFEKAYDLAFSNLRTRYDSSTTDNNNAADFHYTIAMLKGLEGEHQNAYELFQKAIELNPDAEKRLLQDVHILETIAFVYKKKKQDGETIPND